MGLFRLLFAGLVSTVASINDSADRRDAAECARQRAAANGTPYSYDRYGNIIYLPTGEKCIELMHNGDTWLCNKSTHARVFNISAFERRERTKMYIRNTKSQLEKLRPDAKFIRGKSTGCDGFLLELDTMKVYWFNPCKGTDHAYLDECELDSNGKFYDNKIRRIEMTREEADALAATIAENVTSFNFAMPFEERKRLWESC